MVVRSLGELEKTRTASYTPRGRLPSLYAAVLRSDALLAAAAASQCRGAWLSALSACRNLKPQAGGGDDGNLFPALRRKLKGPAGSGFSGPLCSTPTVAAPCGVFPLRGSWCLSLRAPVLLGLGPAV